MVFYKILLRTKKARSVVCERSTTDEKLAMEQMEALRQQMYWWERNTNKFLNDPLEVVIEADSHLWDAAIVVLMFGLMQILTASVN